MPMLGSREKFPLTFFLSPVFDTDHIILLDRLTFWFGCS